MTLMTPYQEFPKIDYHADGTIRSKQWGFNNNQSHALYSMFLHRDDGPAHQSFTMQGKLIREEYWSNGVTHREDGPAIICYSGKGTIRKAEWFFKGKYVDQQVKDWLKENNIHTWTKISKANKRLFKIQVIESLRREYNTRRAK